jgi:hypothetical protein
MLLTLSLVVFCGNIFRFMAFLVMTMEASNSLLSASFFMSPMFSFFFIFLDDFPGRFSYIIVMMMTRSLFFTLYSSFFHFFSFSFYH